MIDSLKEKINFCEAALSDPHMRQEQAEYHEYQLKKSREELRLFLTDGISPERLEEISSAEAEGRLLILPTPEESDYDGLKTKYRVYKARNNEVVEGCFVLRPEKDAAAGYALIAYAGHCKNEILSYDILHWIGKIFANKAFGNDKEEDQP